VNGKNRIGRLPPHLEGEIGSRPSRVPSLRDPAAQAVAVADAHTKELHRNRLRLSAWVVPSVICIYSFIQTGSCFAKFENLCQ